MAFAVVSDESNVLIDEIAYDGPIDWTVSYCAGAAVWRATEETACCMYEYGYRIWSCLRPEAPDGPVYCRVLSKAPSICPVPNLAANALVSLLLNVSRG